MLREIPKAYEPQQIEQRWAKRWAEEKLFRADVNAPGPVFSIVIPPPNVTGSLHIGHMLDHTEIDILTRWRRMQGYNTLYLPGTDHAGISTQRVVVRQLAAQGVNYRDLGREAFERKVWEWKAESGGTITRQMLQLGESCDWTRERFTLSPELSRAVTEVFVRLYEDGLIYRGHYIVNWCPQCRTAISDLETVHEERQGHLWHIRYPIVGSNEYVVVATTRPETMLGDTAVAVHPSDPRYQHLIGKTVNIPLVQREIPIIADGQLVDPAFGTGAVKVTPAHDPNDYACAQRHGLPLINILNPDGTINANGGPYAGLDRYEARTRVTEDMDKLGLFDGREDRDIDLAHSDRSKTPIEPYLSDQWFVLMKDRDGKPGLAQMAIDAVKDGRVKFFPERYAKTYIDWLSEKRDWCISRQLWWGHRIPVWHLIVGVPSTSELTPKPSADAFSHVSKLLQAAKVNDDVSTQVAADNYVYICARTEEAGEVLRNLEKLVNRFQSAEPDSNSVGEFGELAPLYRRAATGIRLSQDPDVLDTWFSSALWPHSTLGWPEQTPELRYYYPTNVLVTNRDIITLWVARMVMTGVYNVGKIPFHHVYIHLKNLDGFGEGMSKTKGNGIDPLDIIER